MGVEQGVEMGEVDVELETSSCNHICVFIHYNKAYPILCKNSNLRVIFHTPITVMVMLIKALLISVTKKRH